MDVKCACGKMLKAKVPPGWTVQCWSCGRTMQVPAGPVDADVGASRPITAQPASSPTGDAASRGRGVSLHDRAALARNLGFAACLLGPLTGIPAVVLAVHVLLRARGTEGADRARRWARTALFAGGLLSMAVSAAVVLAIRLPAIKQERAAAQAKESLKEYQNTRCRFRLGQISAALRAYASDSGDVLPSADRNVPLFLTRYLPPPDGAVADPWCCPADPSPPPEERVNWCSYAPNASVEEKGSIIGAFSSDSRLPAHLKDIAPHTILFIEMWVPASQPPGHPAFLLRPSGATLTDIDRSLVERGRELVPIASYTKPRKVRFDDDGRLLDCGNYLFLRPFLGRRLEDNYHRGRVNVLFTDDEVRTVDIHETDPHGSARG